MEKKAGVFDEKQRGSQFPARLNMKQLSIAEAATVAGLGQSKLCQLQQRNYAPIRGLNNQILCWRTIPEINIMNINVPCIMHTISYQSGTNSSGFARI